MAELTPTKLKAGTLIAFLLIIVAFLGAINYFVFHDADGSEYSLPMLVIDGAVIMIGVLGFASVVYALFGLDDKEQALALPEGSIRAVIAIMLIVMFAIMSIYLFNAISTRSLQSVSNLTQDQVTQLKSDLNTHVMMVTEATDEAKKGTFTVLFSEKANGDGTDIAKQLIILLGTLVTAISSFYFGSKAGNASASDVTTDRPPSIASVFPSEKIFADPFINTAIIGQNLGSAVDLTLTSGEAGKTTLVRGKIISHDDLSIVFNVDDPAKLVAGDWDIKVEFSNKKVLEKKKALKIT
jgi:hypothetical protein